MENKTQEAQIIDKIPFVNLLLQRMNDISVAISQGGTGEPQVENLLFSLPKEWITPIVSEIQDIGQEAINLENKACIDYAQEKINVPERNVQILHIKRGAVRSVMQLVVSILNSKGLLFLSRNPVEESNNSFRDVED